MKRVQFVNVKVEADVARMAKVVAAAKYTTLTSYVTALLRSQVEKDMAAVASELAEQAALATEDHYPRIG